MSSEQINEKKLNDLILNNPNDTMKQLHEKYIS